MRFRGTPRRLTVLAASVAALSATAAQAGFEWSPAPPSATPPVTASAPASVPATPAASSETAPAGSPSSPAGNVVMIDSHPVKRPVPEGMPPMASGANPAHMTPMPSGPHAAPETAVTRSPLAHYTASADPLAGMSDGTGDAPVAAAVPPMPAVMAAPPMRPAPHADTAIVAGFGKDMPLKLAARQIVPKNYRIAFGPGVDPAVRVTWNGGQAWRAVLDNALAARNLSAAVNGDTVTVSAATVAAAPVPTSTPTPDIAAAAPPSESIWGRSGPGSRIAAGSVSAQDTQAPVQPATGLSPLNGVVIGAPVSGAAALVTSGTPYPRHIPRKHGDGDHVSQAAPILAPMPTPMLAPTPAPVPAAPLPRLPVPVVAEAASAAAERPAAEGGITTGAVSIESDDNAPAALPGPRPAAIVSASDTETDAAPSFFFQRPDRQMGDNQAQPAPTAAPTPAIIPAPVTATARPEKSARMAPAHNAPAPPPMPPMPAKPVEITALASPAKAVPPPAMPAAGNQDAAVRSAYATLDKYTSASKAVAVGTATDFAAQPGQSLRAVMTQWCKQAGIELAWTSANDYTVAQPVDVSGTFADAVNRLLAQFAGQKTHPTGSLQSNSNDGAMVYQVSDSNAI